MENKNYINSPKNHVIKYYRKINGILCAEYKGLWKAIDYKNNRTISFDISEPEYSDIKRMQENKLYAHSVTDEEKNLLRENFNLKTIQR